MQFRLMESMEQTYCVVRPGKPPRHYSTMTMSLDRHMQKQKQGPGHGQGHGHGQGQGQGRKRSKAEVQAGGAVLQTGWLAL